MAFSLKMRGVRRAARHARARELLQRVHMEAFADRLPAQLSGGQQQRVALARALAIEPAILLLDEPFAALDRALRLDLQLEIKRLQRRFGITAVLVTHDQDEAMSMADRMAVMRGGRVVGEFDPEQADTDDLIRTALTDQETSMVTEAAPLSTTQPTTPEESRP